MTETYNPGRSFSTGFLLGGMTTYFFTHFGFAWLALAVGIAVAARRISAMRLVTFYGFAAGLLPVLLLAGVDPA